MLTLFASQAASAVANARAYRNERRARVDLEALVETSPVGVLVFDAKNGRPVSFNREARRIVEGLRTPGHRFEQLMEEVVCLHPDGREEPLCEFPLTRRLRAGDDTCRVSGRTREEIHDHRLRVRPWGEVLDAYGNGLIRSNELLPHPQGIAQFASAAICLNVLRPFAIEHFLKGLAVNRVGKFRRSHDLVQLYDDLRPKVQAISEKLAGVDGIEPIRDILCRRRDDIENWRYIAFTVPKPDIQGLTDVDSNLGRVHVHEDFKRLCQSL